MSTIRTAGGVAVMAAALACGRPASDAGDTATPSDSAQAAPAATPPAVPSATRPDTAPVVAHGSGATPPSGARPTGAAAAHDGARTPSTAHRDAATSGDSGAAMRTPPSRANDARPSIPNDPPRFPTPADSMQRKVPPA